MGLFPRHGNINRVNFIQIKHYCSRILSKRKRYADNNLLETMPWCYFIDVLILLTINTFTKGKQTAMTVLSLLLWLKILGDLFITCCAMFRNHGHSTHNCLWQNGQKAMSTNCVTWKPGYQMKLLENQNCCARKDSELW